MTDINLLYGTDVSWSFLTTLPFPQQDTLRVEEVPPPPPGDPSRRIYFE